MKAFDWLGNKYYRPGLEIVSLMSWTRKQNVSYRAPVHRKPRKAMDPKIRELSMNLRKALASIDWTVVEELRHIPRGSHSSAQEALRHEYATFRTFHRSDTPFLQPCDALVQAIVNVRRDHPRFVPKYDHAFFFGGSTLAASLAEDELAMEIHATAFNGGDGRRLPEHTAALNGHVASERNHSRR